VVRIHAFKKSRTVRALGDALDPLPYKEIHHLWSFMVRAMADWTKFVVYCIWNMLLNLLTPKWHNPGILTPIYQAQRYFLFSQPVQNKWCFSGQTQFLKIWRCSSTFLMKAVNSKEM
jgi:hypothetical protein